MTEYALILLSTILVNNFVLVKFLGLCPFMGVSRKLETAMGMALATTFVLTLSSVLALPAGAQDEIKAEWVQVNPLSEQDKLGLGYPPPDLLGTAHIESKGRSQGLLRTGGDTGVAEYALGGEDPFTLFHVCRNVDIHRADLRAGPAIIAGLGVSCDSDSSAISDSRAAGHRGSNGAEALPAFRIPSMAMTWYILFSIKIAILPLLLPRVPIMV